MATKFITKNHKKIPIKHEKKLSSKDVKMFGKKGNFKPIGDDERRVIDQKLQDAQQTIGAMDNGQLPSHQKSQVDFAIKKISSARRQINRVGEHGN